MENITAPTPFTGFSLERSTSFSEEHDESADDRSTVSDQKTNLQQRHIKQVYSEEQGQNPIFDERGNVVAIQDSMRKKLFPLERKPFVFEKEGVETLHTAHLEEIQRNLSESDSISEES